MNNITTISALLALSSSQYRIFDIGRRIEKIAKTAFSKMEDNLQPYPFPSQGHALIAIAFWQKKSTQPYLWLVKLPLDERGLLNQAAMSHFVAIIIEALGADLTKDPTEQQEELLKNNPYVFTPPQYKLASLNSKLKVELKQPASEHLAVFIQYLTDGNWQNWQHIGVQGISDFAARIKQQNHSALLINALPHLPEDVLMPLCGALENETYRSDLIDMVIAQLTVTSDLIISENNQHNQVQNYLLRSLASNCQHPHVEKFIKQLLVAEHTALTNDLLITLSGRCWQALQQPEQLLSFFEHLVKEDNGTLFSLVFRDLVAIPQLRPIVFQCIRSTQRSEKLASAIGTLFQPK